MPLALLAKDSIQDLAALGREAEILESKQLKVKSNTDEGTGGSSLDDLVPSSEQSAANPQQAQEEEDLYDSMKLSLNENSTAYQGFRTDYAGYQDLHADLDYNNYLMHDSYAPAFLAERSKPRMSKFVCCLFPWIQPSNSVENVPYEEHIKADPLETLVKSAQDDDEVSSSSEALGEKMSDKERHAVLARLGLPIPDEEPGRSTLKDGKGLLNEIATHDLSSANKLEETENKIKGILKRGNVVNIQSPAVSSKGEDGTGRRRSLFPVYEVSNKSITSKTVSFAPMARVVTVKSRNDMTSDEKSDIWWVKSDYEDFRRTGRIIAKAILEGGSEIWLASNDSWKSAPNASKSSTLKDALMIAERQKSRRPSSDPDPADTPYSASDKWWHKFGHSRRGLEHVVSVDEGRERQMNVKTAIRAVLDEQVRQKMYHREDPEKLRMVALYHTSWARDLALAAGSSDENAVKSNFNEDRKSREFYLLKMVRTNPTINTGRHVPDFMQPSMHIGPRGPQQHRLDAHTAAQIQFRQTKVIKPKRPTFAEEEKSEASSSEESAEPIRDRPPEEKNHESLAHRAAGFSAEGDEKVNMAAVLSGMGAISHKPTAVTS